MKDYFPEGFACGCGCGLHKFDPRMHALLNRARKQYGRPMVLTSGCRCPEWNAHEGGRPDSAHMVLGDGWCHAADIRCVSNADRWELVEVFRQLGITRMGFGKTFLHVDNATGVKHPPSRYWLYS